MNRVQPPPASEVAGALLLFVALALVIWCALVIFPTTPTYYVQ